jgi:hypothetical protein
MLLHEAPLFWMLHSTYPYKYTHAHPTPMSTSERLDRFDLEIHKVGQKISHYRWGRRLPLKE